MITKVLFLGPPESGKTSLRKFLFEGVPASKLLEESELPTVGLKFNSYSYVQTLPGQKGEKVPVSLSVADSAGQNLDEWLTDRKDRVFPGTDLVFFIFDVSDWLDESKKSFIEDTIMRIYHARLELAPDASFYIIGHKFDKVPEGRTYREQMAKRIKRELNDFVFDKMMKFLDFTIYITSLHSEYEQDTFVTLLNLTTDLLSRVATD